jgi:hypothetical protein
LLTSSSQDEGLPRSEARLGQKNQCFLALFLFSATADEAIVALPSIEEHFAKIPTLVSLGNLVIFLTDSDEVAPLYPNPFGSSL